MKPPIVFLSLVLVFHGQVSASSLVQRATTDIHMITTGAKMFQQTYGVFPAAANWGRELQGTPDAVINAKHICMLQPSIRDALGRMIDPWGNPYVYRHPSRHNTNGVDVYSLGMDGKSATEGDDPDDINNWNPDYPWVRHYHFRYRVRPWINLAVWTALAVVALVLLRWFTKRKNTQPQPGL